MRSVEPAITGSAEGGPPDAGEVAGIRASGLVRLPGLIQGERGQDPAGVSPGGSCRSFQLRTRRPGPVQSVVPRCADTCQPRLVPGFCRYG